MPLNLFSGLSSGSEWHTSCRLVYVRLMSGPGFSGVRQQMKNSAACLRR